MDPFRGKKIVYPLCMDIVSALGANEHDWFSADGAFDGISSFNGSDSYFVKRLQNQRSQLGGVAEETANAGRSQLVFEAIELFAFLGVEVDLRLFKRMSWL